MTNNQTSPKEVPRLVQRRNLMRLLANHPELVDQRHSMNCQSMLEEHIQNAQIAQRYSR